MTCNKIAVIVFLLFQKAQTTCAPRAMLPHGVWMIQSPITGSLSLTVSSCHMLAPRKLQYTSAGASTGTVQHLQVQVDVSCLSSKLCSVADNLLICSFAYRECTGRLLYQGDQDCIFNWSNKHMITWELGFEYADNAAQAKLTYSQHHQQMRHRFRHCAAGDLQMTRGTHR